LAQHTNAYEKVNSYNMEILNQFGFDLRLFAAQIINFLVLVVVFKKFLYKPLLKTLQKREDTISQGLKNAEKAQKALETAELQKDEILKKASQESDKIISEAKLEAQNVRDELMAKTKSDIEQLMAQTKEQIALEKESFMADAKNVSLEMARGILENTIGTLFEKKDQEQLIKKGVAKIKNEQTKN